jgi:hypothetical protein
MMIRGSYIMISAVCKKLQLRSLFRSHVVVSLKVRNMRRRH